MTSKKEFIISSQIVKTKYEIPKKFQNLINGYTPAKITPIKINIMLICQSA